ATGNRGQSRRHRHDASRVDIADDCAIDDVDPAVDDDATRTDVLPSHETRRTCGRDDDVRLTRLRRKIARLSMAHDDGLLLAQEQQRGGLADGAAPSDDDGPFAANPDPRALEDLDGGFGTGRIERVRTELQKACGSRMDPVDVLRWIERVAHPRELDLGWQ